MTTPGNTRPPTKRTDMETITYHDVVDRSNWPQPMGPWHGEPDKVQWLTEAGLPGLIVRGPVGALCGYVGVAECHPYHGLGYDHVAGDFDVHGGLTFAKGCPDDPTPERSICHIAGDGEPDHVWWFGFDCAQLDDVVPGYRSTSLKGMYGESYKNFVYVTREVETLARQLAGVAMDNDEGDEV